MIRRPLAVRHPVTRSVWRCCTRSVQAQPRAPRVDSHFVCLTVDSRGEEGEKYKLFFAPAGERFTRTLI